MADGYTDHDVQIVAHAIEWEYGSCRHDGETYTECNEHRAHAVLAALAGAGRLRNDSDGVTPDEVLRHALAQVETLTYVARRNREHAAELTAIVERVTALTEGLHPEQGVLVGDVLTAVNAPVAVVAEPYRAASIALDDRRPCGECGPGYWIGDEGCQHAAPAGPVVGAGMDAVGPTDPGAHSCASGTQNRGAPGGVR